MIEHLSTSCRIRAAQLLGAIGMRRACEWLLDGAADEKDAWSCGDVAAVMIAIGGMALIAWGVAEEAGLL